MVYDVVQQVFNGSMDRGFNRNLAIDLFQTGRITDRVIEGQRRSDRSQAERRMRLGYMGHLTLIAEEVVKFTERQPAELLAPVVVDKVTASVWINYVEQTLTETRDRDNAILGGVRPDVAGGPRQAVLNAVNAAQGGTASAGSTALANAGLGGGNGPQGLDSMDLANAGSMYGLGSGNLLSGFGSSDEEDEDELDENELLEGTGVGHTQGNEEDQVGDVSFHDTDLTRFLDAYLRTFYLLIALLDWLIIVRVRASRLPARAFPFYPCLLIPSIDRISGSVLRRPLSRVV